MVIQEKSGKIKAIEAKRSKTMYISSQEIIDDHMKFFRTIPEVKDVHVRNGEIAIGGKHSMSSNACQQSDAIGGKHSMSSNACQQSDAWQRSSAPDDIIYLELFRVTYVT